MTWGNLEVGLGCFLIAALGFVLFQWWRSTGAQVQPDHEFKDNAFNDFKQSPVSDSEDVYPSVEPLPEFEWKERQPLKLRHFKPLYHLTMAVQNTDVSSLVEMDWNYLDRIRLKRELMETQTSTVLGAHDRVKPAVDEFYVWLMSEYLPTRFPRMFSLCSPTNVAELEPVLPSRIPASEAASPSHDVQGPTHLVNHVAQEYYSLKPPSTAFEVLKSIGGVIDEDCQFLLPCEDGDGYALEGFANCFPTGFKMSDKLGLKLRDIHGPVPHYKEKLEKSMDRYFDKLQVGKFVRRTNWSVSTTPVLFNPKGNHLHRGEAVPDSTNIDPSVAVLRCELQTLHRLPKTKAILFSFKTYTYNLDEIKGEGLGEDLALAIDGMRDGSAPDMFFYKKAVVWGEKVKAYLRS